MKICKKINDTKCVICVNIKYEVFFFTKKNDSKKKTKKRNVQKLYIEIIKHKNI